VLNLAYIPFSIFIYFYWIANLQINFIHSTYFLAFLWDLYVNPYPEKAKTDKTNNLITAQPPNCHKTAQMLIQQYLKAKGHEHRIHSISRFR
jgi:hypothetical protein